VPITNRLGTNLLIGYIPIASGKAELTNSIFYQVIAGQIVAGGSISNAAGSIDFVTSRLLDFPGYLGVFAIAGGGLTNFQAYSFTNSAGTNGFGESSFSAGVTLGGTRLTAWPATGDPYGFWTSNTAYANAAQTTNSITINSTNVSQLTGYDLAIGTNIFFSKFHNGGGGFNGSKPGISVKQGTVRGMMDVTGTIFELGTESNSKLRILVNNAEVLALLTSEEHQLPQIFYNTAEFQQPVTFDASSATATFNSQVTFQTSANPIFNTIAKFNSPVSFTSSITNTTWTASKPLGTDANKKLITYTIVGSDLPNPSASTLGGIQSLAAVSHKWINTISTAGVPSATQPDVSDLTGNPVSGTGTVRKFPVWASGGTSLQDSYSYTEDASQGVTIAPAAITTFQANPVTITSSKSGLGNGLHQNGYDGLDSIIKAADGGDANPGGGGNGGAAASQYLQVAWAACLTVAAQTERTEQLDSKARTAQSFSRVWRIKPSRLKTHFQLQTESPWLRVALLRRLPP